MKIVVVCYSYAPAETPRAFRWGAICAELAAKGHYVEVVTGQFSGSPHVETLNGVHVYRVGGRVGELVRDQLGGNGARLPEKSTSPRPAGMTGVAARLVKLVHNATWKQIYWPDSNCLWYFPALREARRLLRGDPEKILVSVSLPFIGHLVGLTLKRDDPRRPWLVDIGDPFSLTEHTPTSNPHLYRSLNRRADLAVIRAADALTVTTGRAAEAYAEVAPEVAARFHVIPPLLSLPESEHDERADRAKGAGEIELLFIGTLYTSLRSPDYLLRVFENMALSPGGSRFRLRFIGQDGGCAKLAGRLDPKAAARIRFEGVKPRSEASVAMRQADILVNIGNDTGFQLPSKLVEYASSGKPIVNVVRSERDTSVDFLRPHPGVFILLSDDEGPDALARVAVRLAEWCESAVAVGGNCNEEWVASFTPKANAAAYEALLARLSKK